MTFDSRFGQFNSVCNIVMILPFYKLIFITFIITSHDLLLATQQVVLGERHSKTEHCIDQKIDFEKKNLYCKV